LSCAHHPPFFLLLGSGDRNFFSDPQRPLFPFSAFPPPSRERNIKTGGVACPFLLLCLTCLFTPAGFFSRLMHHTSKKKNSTLLLFFLFARRVEPDLGLGLSFWCVKDIVGNEEPSCNPSSIRRRNLTLERHSFFPFFLPLADDNGISWK